MFEGAANLAALATHIEQALSGRHRLRSDGGYTNDASDQEWRQIPLAASQQHVGFLARYSSGSSSAFNEPLILDLEGPLRVSLLQAAVKAVVDRHEGLRAALSPDTDALTLGPSLTSELAVSGCSEGELPKRLTDVVTQPFQAGEPLFRAQLLRLAETHHVLVLVSHALVVDFEALCVVVNDIAQFYSACSRGAAPHDTSAAVQLTAYMARHDEASAKQARAAANAHWQEILAAGIPHLELPSDRPRPAVKSYDGARLVMTIDAELQRRLHDWPETTPQLVFFAAYLALIHRFTVRNDIVVGARSAPMHTAGEQRLVCPTRNMVPVRSDYDPDRSFANQVRHAAAALAEADRHRHFSLAELLLALRLPRDQGRSPLFSAAFAVQSYPVLVFDGLRCALAAAPNIRARYDVDLTFIAARDGVQLICDYSTELFDHDTMVRWLDGLTEFVRAGLQNDQLSCSQLPIMPERQRRKLLYDWNATQRVYPHDRTVLDLFLKQLRARPDQVAVRCVCKTSTYRQLGERIEQIASLLHAAGAKAGEPVAILLQRSPDLLAAIFAAWRIGAPYVPLDPAAPKRRSTFMMEDAGVRTVVTSRRLAGIVANMPGMRALFLDAPDRKTVPLGSGIPASSATHSAYIIYTSGSSGQPKGVEVAHRSLVNCLEGVRTLLGFSATDSVLAIAPPTFDISTVELFMPVSAGGVVELAEDGVAGDGLRLAECIQACRPSYVQATSSMWKLLLAAGWKGDPNLSIGCGGEPLSRELAEVLLGKVRALWNMYGPTETTVNDTVHRVRSEAG